MKVVFTSTTLVLTAFCLFSTSCKTRSDVSQTKATSSQERDRAMRAVDILGASRPGYNGPKVCGGACHVPSWHAPGVEFIKNLADITQTTNKCFETAGSDDKAWIGCLKDEEGQWKGRIGVFRAGVHTSMFESKFKEVFGEDYLPTYQAYVEKIKMPPTSNEDVPKLIAEGDFNTVRDWMIEGMPGLDQVFIDASTSQTCSQSISPAMQTHVESMYTQGWEAVNNGRDNLSMFGCDEIGPGEYIPYETASECFYQKKDGKSLYPIAEDNPFNGENTKSWAAPLPQKLRILKRIPWSGGNASTYWMRSSADGRFIGNGLVQARPSLDPSLNVKLKAYIFDLSQDKMISVSADYDPGFFPNNKGFSFIEAAMGAVWFCDQNVLINASEALSFRDMPNQCFPDKEMGVYQHLSVDPFQVSNAPHIVVRSDDYSNDSGGQLVYKNPDVSSFAKESSKLEVHLLHRNGESYKKDAIINKKVPFQGDFSISPSGKILISRFSSTDGTGENDRVQLGYKFHKIKIDDQQDVQLEEVANVCVKGGKGMMSYNERFFVTHNYTHNPSLETRPLREKMKASKSDIELVDFKTGRHYTLTQMNLGQFALYPHFRSDNWLYFLVRDVVKQIDYVVASDIALVIGYNN